MSDPSAAADVESIVAALSLFVTAGAAVFAAYAFRRDQSWKRRLEILNRVDIMYENTMVSNAISAIDYQYRPIFAGKDRNYLGKNGIFTCTPDKIVDALQTPNFQSCDISVVYLRDCFDALCSEMSVFAHFVETRLIELDDLAPYLGYVSWLTIRTESHQTEEVRTSFQKFAQTYYSVPDIWKMLQDVEMIAKEVGRKSRPDHS